MKVYKLSEYTHEITLLDIPCECDVFCDLLQCDSLDFATFASVPGEFRIVAIVDDVGAIVERNPTCFYASGLGVLYGTVLFARHYYDSPDFSDVQPEDLKIIQYCMIKKYTG